jgi:hypothetical protein
MKKLADYTVIDLLNWVAIALVLFSSAVIITQCVYKD